MSDRLSFAKAASLMPVMVVLGLASSPALAMRVAVLHVGCYSEASQNLIQVEATTALVHHLEASGVEVLPDRDLCRYLSGQRIRRPEFLDRPTIRIMGKALGIDALVMGHADSRILGGVPRVTVSLQMVDCRDATVAWATSISRTGEDFATLLGLGRIRGLDTLLKRVMAEALAGIPSELQRQEVDPPPFELVSVDFMPGTLRGSEQALLTLEIMAFEDDLQVRAYLLDKEIPLNRDGRKHHGWFAAPPLEGRYPLTLSISDSCGTGYDIEGATSLTVHNSPPHLILRSTQKVISPDGDGHLDHALMMPEDLRMLSVRGWRATIMDAQGRTVRREEGFGMLPQAFVWQGADDRGMTVPDGPYRFMLSVEDAAGNISLAPAVEILVDTTPPRVSVTLAPSEGGADELELAVEEPSGFEFWELAVLDPDGASVARFDGLGVMPSSRIEVRGVPGKPSLGAGEAAGSYSLRARDLAGNRLEIEGSPLLRHMPAREHEDGQGRKPENIWIEDF